MLNKKTVSTTWIVAILLASNLSLAQDLATEANQNQARYDELKATIFSRAYATLPQYKVNKTLFKNPSKANTERSESRLLRDARRTMRDRRDLLSSGRGQKLLQANGICFAGQWFIDNDSEYSGLFRFGTSVKVIARASVSFSGTKQNQRRALGLAVKLLPSDLGSLPSLNVFSLHSVGGVKTKYLLDLSLDNEPPLGRIPRFQDIPTALKLKSELLKADKEAGSVNPSVTYRTIDPLAAYKETNVSAPRWIRFNAATSARVDQQDFRDELRVENYPNKQLIYNIEVGHHSTNKKSKAQWQRIGKLVFSESITSKACDTQLHFAHPKN